MDFKDLMNIASNNQVNTVNKIKNRKSKDGSSNQVSSAAVKAFLDRQKAEKAKQKEQEEAARRARIQARLQEKQLDRSKNSKKLANSPNDSVDDKPKHSKKNVPSAQDLTTSISKNQSKLNLAQKKKTNDEKTIVKSKEKDKVMKRSEEKTKAIEHKKPVIKVKKPAQPVMSFQELMNVAKKQADNPDAFRSVAPANAPKIGKNIDASFPAQNRSMEDKRNTEIQNGNSRAVGISNREKTTVSQNKQNVKTQGRKLPEAAKRKKQESCDRKQLEMQSRKLPSKGNGNNDRKFPGKAVIDGSNKRKSCEKPKIMTIERQTISQREYGSPMKRHESKSHFKRKRRPNPCDEDEYDDDMDEFIDDSEEAPETVSSYIKEIFGYDRHRFRDRDEDINNMESSYGDIQKEEAKSLRIAKLEDEVEKLKESYELERQQRKKKKLKH